MNNEQLTNTYYKTLSQNLMDSFIWTLNRFDGESNNVYE